MHRGSKQKDSRKKNGDWLRQKDYGTEKWDRILSQKYAGKKSRDAEAVFSAYFFAPVFLFKFWAAQGFGLWGNSHVIEPIG